MGNLGGVCEGRCRKVGSTRMRDRRYDYRYQVRNAKRMAKEHNRPVRVFMVYMPSVYPVGRSPLKVEPMPEWHEKRQAFWVSEMLAMASTVVMPDGTVHESERAPKKPKSRKRPSSTKQL